MTLTIREARRDDVAAIRALLADDRLGAAREDMSDEGLEKYLAAFDAIAKDPRNHLMVAEEGGEIIGTYQVTYIPYLSRGGNQRAHIEAVRVKTDLRSRGIGRAMMDQALADARARGCLLAQLTTDKTRPDAHRFYLSLGFAGSHEGMKLVL